MNTKQMPRNGTIARKLAVFHTLQKASPYAVGDLFMEGGIFKLVDSFGCEPYNLLDLVAGDEYEYGRVLSKINHTTYASNAFDWAASAALDGLSIDDVD